MTTQMSSEEDADRRLPFTMWCRACGHTHHSHKRHFKLNVEHRPYGMHCGCCDNIFSWQEQVSHVNKYKAHERLPVCLVAPIPVTTMRNESCFRYRAKTDMPRRHLSLPSSHTSTSAHHMASTPQSPDPDPLLAPPADFNLPYLTHDDVALAIRSLAHQPEGHTYDMQDDSSTYPDTQFSSDVSTPPWRYPERTSGASVTSTSSASHQPSGPPSYASHDSSASTDTVLVPQISDSQLVRVLLPFPVAMARRCCPTARTEHASRRHSGCGRSSAHRRLWSLAD